jgi:hypothetical protein
MKLLLSKATLMTSLFFAVLPMLTLSLLTIFDKYFLVIKSSLPGIYFILAIFGIHIFLLLVLILVFIIKKQYKSLLGLIIGMIIAYMIFWITLNVLADFNVDF